MKRSYGEFLGQERRPLVNRETTSLPDQLDGFYGRDGDMEAIRSLLLSDDANADNPGVIPMVGMGGIGKTTLAQHVYNDEEVAKQFNIQGWICVSVEFMVLSLTKLILEEVTGTAPVSNNLNQLQRNLKGALAGKKFLLVLDDVWSEDYDGWNKLLTPLRYGAAGSKIIITTRQQSVASVVQTVPTHFLKELEDEDCWKLFARHARLDVNSTANPPELQKIGEKIVRKCGGLPLAARALGGVLRWETKFEKMKEVLESEIWEVQNANILPALAMSYIHLPSHLKRCFAYCAIFPQDYEFRKEKLVALWMSEGFLVQRKGNQSWEEIGDRYFDNLLSRSFFQRKDDYFVLHDLVHDLARFVSGEFCSRLEGKNSWKIGERTRHLSYERDGEGEDVLEKFQAIRQSPFLRSFVLADKRLCYFHGGNMITCINKEVINGLLPTRQLLRVLFLSCREIRELPNSIGNLKHMRHLDLSYTSITLLPEAVTALFNLEILILRHCITLVELPADMARLINLCRLDISFTNLVEWPPDMARLINLCQLDLSGTHSLKGMPPEMGKLKKLSKLSDFVVGGNGSSSIKELGHLHCLGGRISISRLQNVKDYRDASEANLKDKKNLKVLELGWNVDADNSRQVKRVLEGLQPHTKIESIEIHGYDGTKFPTWLGDISYSKLKRLSLRGRFGNSICFPPLGQLASLENLRICGFAVPKGIGSEFYGMCIPGEKPFSSLKRLVFDDIKNWREWSSCNGAFPVLEELKLNDCLKLMSVPDLLPSLKRLWIHNCGELDIENLLISTCATLETINIQWSEKVKCISVETFPNLKELEMRNCSNLESFGSTAAATRTTMTSDPLFSPSLTSLSIIRCSKLVSFPREGLHAPNLKSIQIERCGNFKSLPQGMHSLLPSLESLKMNLCRAIESLPEEGLPSSLSSLDIRACPLLQKRCEREIGEDWPKIKHIPHLTITKRTNR